MTLAPFVDIWLSAGKAATREAALAFADRVPALGASEPAYYFDALTSKNEHTNHQMLLASEDTRCSEAR